MDTAIAHIDLQNQLVDLYRQISVSYKSLKLTYEQQGQALKESKLSVIAYKHQAHYWEAQFKQIKTREEELKAELEELQAKLRKREQQLFGKHSEKQSTSLDQKKVDQEAKKKRGQQPENASPNRRDYSDLPEVEEVVELNDQENYCPCCGLKYQELAGTEDSEVLELINVQAYRRRICRKRYKRACRCKNNPAPQIITMPPMERPFSRSKLGITIWAHLLIQKYAYQNPLNRILSNLELSGLSLSMGTVTGGLEYLLRLFIPVYDGIALHNCAAQHWHADETGWKVFEKIDGKESTRWFLWIFQNSESVVYKISPSRSSQVVKDYFGEDHGGGILNVDRYGAYKAIAKAGLFILAFCWAHVRRDFLDYSKAYPHQESWGLEWVERIGRLYHINNQRIEHKPSSKQFQLMDTELRKAIKEMADEMIVELKDSQILPSAKKLLKSLSNHWKGLTVFVDHPDIPMDNNVAERGLRTSVLGRKNYYGSGSVWSAELAAVMFTILRTMKLWEINPHTWLLAYLQECAMRGGNPPDNIDPFLPWNMSKSLRELMAQPPKHEPFCTS
jgi:transposase